MAKEIKYGYIVLLNIAIAAFAFAFFPVWKSLVHLWLNSDDYSHGLFIIPLALFIAWQKRDRLLTLSAEKSWRGLLTAISALLAFLFGSIAHIATLQSLAMVFFIAGAVWFLFGSRFFREMRFPLFLLFFIVPVPAQLFAAATIQLQLFVSAVSSNILSGLGVSLYREGNVICLPNQTLQVVQACSGLRSLLAILTLSAVFAYLALRSNMLRGFLFLSGIPIAIIANVFRVVLLIVFIYFYGIDLAHGTPHIVFGLSIFALALLFLYLLYRLLMKWDSRNA